MGRVADFAADYSYVRQAARVGNTAENTAGTAATWASRGGGGKPTRPGLDYFVSPALFFQIHL